ncbi:tetratricopeptide repeat protein [Marivirga arenosa]|uniref:Tetratricopeptide repeat protein n=1 Tax=Marivirga arenosa TaxID=3059076 RepID=A0AA49JA98_9BACT|nr:tetratricopeptide repeat protein [Marivirga sp. BKB1-2]WKK80860.2 tetratricopeptide repeat protein [Marivirga sp. BKB1-2]
MEDINILLTTASNYCQKGEYKQGIHLYSQYITQNNQNPIAFYQRGKAYFKIKDYQAAQSDLSKAIKLKPDSAELFAERGLIYYMAKQQDAAITDFNTAVEMEPENPFRYASRAFIKDHMNDLAGAKDDYQKALELDPEDAISHNNLGLVLGKMGNHKRAEEHYKDAEKLDPKNFGMKTNNAKETPEVAPQPKPEPTPLPNIKKEEKVSGTANFGNTLKALISSSEERKEFWSFVKNKVFKAIK